MKTSLQHINKIGPGFKISLVFWVIIAAMGIMPLPRDFALLEIYTALLTLLYSPIFAFSTVAGVIAAYLASVRMFIGKAHETVWATIALNLTAPAAIAYLNYLMLGWGWSVH